MSMKTIETKVYTFNELSDDAKDVARSWSREHALDYDWYDSIYDEAATIGLKITSFDLDRNRHAEGELSTYPEIAANNILVNHGKGTDTYKLAAAFLKAQDTGKLKDEDEESQRQADLSEDFERDLLEEYSVMLQHEYEYMNENEHIDDAIEANEYTFTESGKRFG
jgi:hypothetical protein